MKSVELTTFPRSLTKRTQLKQVRGNGRVPAVIYGTHNPPQNLEIPYKAIEDITKHSASENILVDLKVEGDGQAKRLAMVKDVQHNPLSGKILHVDFQEVAEDEQVIITVPVEARGESVGVKVGGGVLEHVLFKTRVRGVPKDLPEVITVDVRELGLGESVHIGDLQVPEGVELLGDKKLVVMSVAEGRAAAAAAAAAATETAK